LLRAGFARIDRGKGSHRVYLHPDGRRTMLAFHGRADIPTGTLHKIIRDIGISVQEFNDSI
jgi:predicted RNA binding protein YcfA (HicA-like mRNA interferase family)